MAMQLTHDIVPTHLVINAMRDSGYKNAAYAIAELMDNSIQAGATQVELLCGERRDVIKQRQRSRIYQLAVLDNGCGMNAEVLRLALQFGNGTRLAPELQTGIGRFGMGLPNSSVSQARRVEVWSWQNGLNSALYTYIDIDEIRDNGMREIPEPYHVPIPDVWLNAGKSFEDSGTLVVWSNIDRCIWRSAKSIIDNSKMLIGRMYRYFLYERTVSIRLVSFDIENRKFLPDIEEFAFPNDPIYLMDQTSCPEPFNATPMFQPWGDPMEFRIRFQGSDHSVWVRFSYAKEEARLTDNAGSLPHGRHAKDNVGVSIVRADRELELDTTWINSYDPRERWWGAEVLFPPTLDDLFGVTNNKQSARNFSQMAKEDVDQLTKEYQSFTAAREDLEAQEDPRMTLAEIVIHLQKNIKQMRELIQNQTRGYRPVQKRHEESRAEQKGTEVTRRRVEELGKQGTSDLQEEQQPLQQRKVEIIEKLVEQGVAETQAEQIASQTIGRGFKYAKAIANLESPVFFDVSSRGGSILVSLNANHPAYEHLVELLEESVENSTEDELKSRLTRAREGLELLLFAWARYEDEQINAAARSRVQDARIDWGRIARDFLMNDD
ncbi:MAG: histidine kinase [Chloroflexota bacterium]|nr:MAG: histidine kinase [Chloroflexota bacterium]